MYTGANHRFNQLLKFIIKKKNLTEYAESCTLIVDNNSKKQKYMFKNYK